MEYWLSLASSLIIASLCSVLAYSKKRSPLWWFVLGILFGLFALIVVFILPTLGEQPKSTTVAGPEQAVPPEVTQPPSTEEPFELMLGWFYLDQEKQVCGPFTAQGLKEKWESGLLSENSWVWNEDIVEWKKISQVQSLIDWLRRFSEGTATVKTP